MHRSLCHNKFGENEWTWASGAQVQPAIYCQAEANGVWGVQSNETELLLEEVNSYQRAIQYQQLEKAQFGASEPPGFYHEAST